MKNIKQEIPAVLSCRNGHLHGNFTSVWNWNLKMPLELKVEMILPDGYTSDLAWENLTLTVARDLVFETVVSTDFKVRGTVGAVTMKIRKSMPNVMIVAYEHGVFMVQRDKVAAFLKNTYDQVDEYAECNELDLDRLAARLQYS